MPFSRPHTPNRELTVGFAGLGGMGYPMARNIATRQVSATFQPPILVWNRTRAKAEALQREAGQSKIRIANDVEELATSCDVIITNLANDEVVKQVYESFAAVLKDRQSMSNKIFVETSTVYPTLAGAPPPFAPTGTS